MPARTGTSLQHCLNNLLAQLSILVLCNSLSIPSDAVPCKLTLLCLSVSLKWMSFALHMNVNWMIAACLVFRVIILRKNIIGWLLPKLQFIWLRCAHCVRKKIIEAILFRLSLGFRSIILEHLYSRLFYNERGTCVLSSRFILYSEYIHYPMSHLLERFSWVNELLGQEHAEEPSNP